MCATAMPSPEDSVSQHMSLSFGSYVLLSSLPQSSLTLERKVDTNIVCDRVLTVVYSQQFEQLGVSPLVTPYRHK